MKAQADWKPSKFLWQNDSLKIGPALPPHSWLIGRELAEIYSRLIIRYANGVLIDLGCGQAPLYALYRYYAHRIICVDWPSSSHKLLHADILCDLNHEIALPDNSADTILCTDVLEHLYNPQKMFSEVSRILIPGGKIIVGTPFLYWLHEEPNDYYRYTSFGLRLLCEQNKLHVISLETIGGSVHVLLDIIAKHLLFSRILSRLFFFFCRMILSMPGMKQISRKTAQKFPLGHVVVAERIPDA